MSNKSDKKIRDILNKNINEIPMEIDKNIEDTLKKISRKKKGNYKKIVLIASSISICILGFTMKIQANRNTIKSDIFDEFGVNENYSKYGIEVNKVAEEKSNSELNNSIGITVESLIYDGYTLTIGYEYTDTGEPLVWHGIIDVKEYRLNNSSTQGIIENGKVRAVSNIEIFEEEALKKYVGKKGENFEITLFTDIGNERYQVKQVIRNDDIKENIREEKINLKIDGKRIEKLVVTPMNIYIFGYGDKNEVKDVIELENLNGEKIQEKGLSVTSRFGIRDNFIMTYENKDVDGIILKGQDKNIEISEGKIYEKNN
ncbi:MAG: DUF4179 domain-containing protein [Clostridium sp.]